MNFAVSTTHGEAAQARLLAALASPVANTPVEIVALEMAGAAVLTGVIFDRSGRRIGAIENFQVNFLRPGDGESLETLRRQADALPRRVNSAPEWRAVRHDSAAISYSAPIIPVEQGDLVAVERPGGAIVFEAAGEIEIQLYAHPWSGIVVLRHRDEEREIDLYQPHVGAPRLVRLDLGPEPQRVEIVVTGLRNECARGAQCLFGGFRVKTGRDVPLRHGKAAKVRGAPFSGPFLDLLAGVPPGGLLLDVGGGNRQFDDPCYINLDSSDYPEPDLIADALQLPLRDGSVDAVYSSGVFEHLSNPLRAGAEVARVLKPGGKAVIDWAFMQPIHAEGLHFFNATPWGVERSFPALKLNRLWYSTSFEFLVRWGASVSDLVGRVPQEEIDQVCATLQRWDGLIPESHKAYMANSVWAEFEKP